MPPTNARNANAFVDPTGQPLQRTKFHDLSNKNRYRREFVHRWTPGLACPSSRPNGSYLYSEVQASEKETETRQKLARTRKRRPRCPLATTLLSVDAPPRGIATSLQSIERGACPSRNRIRGGTTSPANQPPGSSVRLANSSRTDVFLVASWRTIQPKYKHETWFPKAKQHARIHGGRFDLG